mgnify:CR=1 FL=1
MDAEYQFIGVVTHYFDRLGVAVVRLEQALYQGDWVAFFGKHTDFEQQVRSMEIDHQAVTEVPGGEEVAIQVDAPVRKGDKVFLIVESAT